ncbi:MAG: tetratricopeptide repeat protein [Pseudomonadota bacterium]|nr:MAG: hypothetical protein DIU78_01060 [Pseudomonadota bacterium]
MRPPRSRSVSLHFTVRFAATLLGSVSLFAPAVAAAGPRDEQALRMAEEAINQHYLNEKYRQAERGLKKALQRCGRRGCSKEVMGRLNRDLAMVQVALGKPKEARRRFKRALRYDPDIQLDASLVTPEVEEAFRDAGGNPPPVATPMPQPQSEPEPDRERGIFDADAAATQQEEDEEEEEAFESSSRVATSMDDDEEPNPNELPDFEEESSWDDVGGKRKKKRGDDGPPGFYFSLNAQQDALLVPAEQSICNLAQANQYNCFDHTGEEYAGPIWDRYGNQVPGGVALATTRVMLGLDGRLGENVLLGVRLGYAFRGAPTPRNGDGFVPWHAELRLAYHFGTEPFARGKVRPFLSLGSGLAQVDSHILMDYFTSETAYRAGAKPGRLDVWRRVGRFFVAPGLGLMIPTSTSSGFALEVRGMYLFDREAYGGAGSLGYVIGL